MPTRRNILEIRSDGRNRLEQNTPITNFTETGTISNLLDILGLESENIYNQIEKFASIFDPTTNSGKALDNIGFFLGTPRNSSTVAVDLTTTNFMFFIDPKISLSIGGLINKIYPSDKYYAQRKLLYDEGYIDNVTSPNFLKIPLGTTVSNQDGTVLYTTTKDVYFNNSMTEVYSPVIANVFGLSGNAEANSLVKHSLNNVFSLKEISNYLLCTNRFPISTGSSGESDEDYRYKIVLSRQAIKSNEQNIRLVALSIPGVRDILLERGRYGNGTVNIIIEGTSPLVSDGLIDLVQQRLTALVAGGDKIFVTRPIYLGVELNIEIINSLGADGNSLREEVRNKIIQYINNLSIGETIVWNEIIELIMTVPGVTDFIVNYFKIGTYDILNKINKLQRVVRTINQRAEFDSKFITDVGMCCLCCRI